MSTSTLSVQADRVPLAVLLSDYLQLGKPRIAVLELVTVAVAATMAGLQPGLLLHTLLGTALVAVSASALNQWWERELDGRMDRTVDRPLPSGRLTGGKVLGFAFTLVLLGLAYLALAVNLTTAALGLMSWVLYVLVYTPLKTRSPANTFIGAIAGALPILMGWSAMGQPLWDVKAATLFLIVFLWQFPHFMAIAWLYRHQYAQAGMKMLTVVDPSGRRAGAQAVVVALMLIPVSLVPAVLPLAGSVYIYFAGALLLGIAQFLCAVVFLLRRDDTSARRLLRASLIYLPAILLLMLATPIMLATPL